MTDRTLSITLRPTKFEEVLGQEKTVAALQKQLTDERIPIAFLFSGPAGTGKTTLAHIIAREVNGDAVPEIIEHNASNLNGVDDIRELVSMTDFHPLNGKYRVVILDEAQRLTEAAQNVLLKPMEIADSSTIWIICTTEPTKLIKPLKDRCVSYVLKPLSSPDIKRLIAKALTAGQTRCLAGDTPLDVSGLVKKDGPTIFDALEKFNINAPREILMTVEKFLGGVPAEEAAARTENEAEFIDVARAVGKGNWERCAEALKGLKSTDLKPLRGMVASYLASMLLGAEGKEQEAISDSIKGLFSYTGAEEATKAGIYDWLFRSCRRLAKS